MASDSAIQWTDATFNPWRGCVKVSAGCANCYAESLSKQNPKTLGVWGANGTRVVAAPVIWGGAKKWNENAAAGLLPDGNPNPDGHRPRVFCASLADVFEAWEGPMVDSKGNPLAFGDTLDGWRPMGQSHDVALTMQGVRNRLARLILDTPNLDWLLLTKRPENVNDFWPLNFWPANAWVGTTAENQEQADRRIPELLKVRAKVRFLSVEPMLGPVKFEERFPKTPGMSRDYLTGQFHGVQMQGVNGHPDFVVSTVDDKLPKVHWVIVGGESGPHARPFEPAWALEVMEQCRAAGTPVFVKQLGSKPQLLAVRDKKGGDWSEWPELLKVREFPEVPR